MLISLIHHPNFSRLMVSERDKRDIDIKDTLKFVNQKRIELGHQRIDLYDLIKKTKDFHLN